MVLGLASGAVSLSLSDVGQGLLDTLLGETGNQTALIVGQIRLPRVLLAAVMGATLAISGAAMQGLPDGGGGRRQKPRKLWRQQRPQFVGQPARILLAGHRGQEKFGCQEPPS